MKLSLVTLLTIFSVFLTSLTSSVNAWGADGHQTVGQIAQNFLRPDIARKVAALFRGSFGGQLPQATLWADSVKNRRGYTWSKNLHYIDTNDDPGRRCFVDEDTDCPDGNCVVGAIANFTTQLGCGNDINTRDIALRFLAHFYGDITQPLHTCGRQKGGNGVFVTFDGRRANLHAIWDTNMVEKRLLDFNSDFVQYSNFLTNEIRNGKYASESNGWACIGSGTKCPLSWAIESNAINCPFVWTVDDNPDADLGDSYYRSAVPIIDRQLARGGYRLGVFLNSILSNC